MSVCRDIAVKAGFRAASVSSGASRLPSAVWTHCFDWFQHLQQKFKTYWWKTLQIVQIQYTIYSRQFLPGGDGHQTPTLWNAVYNTVYLFGFTCSFGQSFTWIYSFICVNNGCIHLSWFTCSTRILCISSSMFVSVRLTFRVPRKTQIITWTRSERLFIWQSLLIQCNNCV